LPDDEKDVMSISEAEPLQQPTDKKEKKMQMREVSKSARTPSQKAQAWAKDKWAFWISGGLIASLLIVFGLSFIPNSNDFNSQLAQQVAGGLIATLTFVVGFLFGNSSNSSK